MEEDIQIKRAARVVLFDENDLTPIVEVRGGEYYKIPGGGVETGETEEQAAIREACEEAGCEVAIMAKIGEHDFVDPEQPSKTHHSVCFLAKLVGDKRKNAFDSWERSNDFQLHWVTFDEAVRLFSSSVTQDKFGVEINKRDLDFLKEGRKLFLAYAK
ncbi:NUDIX hydrolase [Patescibacteria group bacterium]|nr:MAG: NUDIX hydrolase [Patescibacteria group bacterium]